LILRLAVIAAAAVIVAAIVVAIFAGGDDSSEDSPLPSIGHDEVCADPGQEADTRASTAFCTSGCRGSCARRRSVPTAC
jgi:hypothetical protein